jgi:hypothetical protein
LNKIDEEVIHWLCIDFVIGPSEVFGSLRLVVQLDCISTNLAATMVRWCEEGVNQGCSLPMAIIEEESNLFCACHLLNCD